MLNLLFFPFRFVRWLWMLVYIPLSRILTTIARPLSVVLFWLSKAWIAVPLVLLFGWMALRLDPMLAGYPDRPASSYVDYPSNQNPPLSLLLGTTLQLKEMVHASHRADQRVVVGALALFFLILKVMHSRLEDAASASKRMKQKAAERKMPLLWKSAPKSVKPLPVKKVPDKKVREEKVVIESPPPKAPQIKKNSTGRLFANSPKSLPVPEVAIACEGVAKTRNIDAISADLPEELQRLVGFKR